MKLRVDFEEQVREVLRTYFPGAFIDVERYNGAKRINGYIQWAGFADMEPLERANLVFDALEAELGEDTKEISVILAYTPQEWERMHDE